MSTQNSVLMKQAQDALAGKWGLAVGTFVVFMVISVLIQLIPFGGPILALAVGGPFTIGIAIFSLNIARGREAKLEQIFDGFKDFVNAMVAYLLMILFVVLWSLLLIIPGIIAAFSYSLTFFLLADDPSLSPMQAIDKSKALMDGHKAKLFRLYLRIAGLALLCLLTLGIGFFFLYPYAAVTFAKFYIDVKGSEAENPEGYLGESLDQV